MIVFGGRVFNARVGIQAPEEAIAPVAILSSPTGYFLRVADHGVLTTHVVHGDHLSCLSACGSRAVTPLAILACPISVQLHQAFDDYCYRLLHGRGLLCDC